MKQALVGQGMYREQENSHPEWPDYTITNAGDSLGTQGHQAGN